MKKSRPVGTLDTMTGHSILYKEQPDGVKAYWDGKQVTCRCPAYEFPHRFSGGNCNGYHMAKNCFDSDPLSLRCDAINMSVRDVINKCRDRVLSKHLVHNSTVVGGSALGSPVAEGSLTQRFAEARDCAKIKIEKDKTPPTFHEQRSLSERLYKAQGINTQELLGHSSAKMTELYHDERREKWIIIAV